MQLGKRGTDQADRAQGPGTWPTCHLDTDTWMNFQAGSHIKGPSDGVSQQEARARQHVVIQVDRQASRGQQLHPKVKKEAQSQPRPGPEADTQS